MPTAVQDLESILSQSAASDAFKSAVVDLKNGKRPSAITFNSGSPPVKVLRVITKLLEEFPAEQIESVELSGQSGCSDFQGTLSVNNGSWSVKFEWDCKWRAEQEGWTDHFGYPDQMRAAREFGYQCFSRFKRS